MEANARGKPFGTRQFSIWSATGAAASAFAAPPTGGTAGGQAVTASRVLSSERTQFTHQANTPQTPYSILAYCLGTTLTGVSNAPAQWSNRGHAINSCPVAMKWANLHVLVQNNCSLGSSIVTDDIAFTPPNWNSGSGADWGDNGASECFLCTDGFMTAVPPYTVTVSAGLNGTGTNNVNYSSEPPDVEITIVMKQYRLRTVC